MCEVRSFWAYLRRGRQCHLWLHCNASLSLFKGLVALLILIFRPQLRLQIQTGATLGTDLKFLTFLGASFLMTIALSSKWDSRRLESAQITLTFNDSFLIEIHCWQSCNVKQRLKLEWYCPWLTFFVSIHVYRCGRAGWLNCLVENYDSEAVNWPQKVEGEEAEK